MAAKTPKHTLCFSRNAETVAWNLDLKKNKHIKRKIRFNTQSISLGLKYSI